MNYTEVSHMLPSSPKHHTISQTQLSPRCPPWPAPWTFTPVPLLQAPFPPPPHSSHPTPSVEDITEEVACKQDPDRWPQHLCYFTFQRKTSANFTPLFWYSPCVPVLSAGQGKVSAFCVPESRQVEFPFSVQLPDERNLDRFPNLSGLPSAKWDDSRTYLTRLWLWGVNKRALWSRWHLLLLLINILIY